VALPAAAAGFASLIAADFPALFAEFRGKRFALLWHCSRDGFRRARFSRPLRRSRAHSGTDPGHGGEHFRGFTPVEWESQPDSGVCWKADPSLKSFLLMLKNAHNFPARKFALKPEKKVFAEAIICDYAMGILEREVPRGFHAQSGVAS
jgi:hypothetical protein